MYGSHIVNQIHHPDLVSDSTLHVILVVSNPIRVHSRLRLFREAYERMLNTPNVAVYVVETAFGDRHHEVTEASDPNHLQLRTHSEIWIKENMINLAVRRLLPNDWKYMAWVDADIEFRDSGWALETIHQLQHFAVVQPWSDCSDLGPYGNHSGNFKSFGHQHQKRIPKQTHPSQPYQYAHSGFAWACTRAFYERVGGLMEFPILGSADHHMAFAMIGKVNDTIHSEMHENFFEKCREWERKAVQACQNEVGFVYGRIEHSFHGPKRKRYYRERWQILVDHKFDPKNDLSHDSQGLVTLVDKPVLEQSVRQYNRSRAEDSIEE